MYSTKPCNSKWAAVNDGDDGDDNDDEDAVNKIWMMESFEGVTMQTASQNFFSLCHRENVDVFLSQNSSTWHPARALFAQLLYSFYVQGR